MTTQSVSTISGEIQSYSVSTFRLRRRTPGSFVLVPFPKGGRSIRCQGQLEAAAAVILANCPLAETIQEQPLQIWYAWRETESVLEIRLLDQHIDRTSLSMFFPEPENPRGRTGESDSACRR